MDTNSLGLRVVSSSKSQESEPARHHSRHRTLTCVFSLQFPILSHHKMHEYWDPTDEKLIDKRSYLVKNVSSTSSTVLATSRHYSAQAQEVRDKTVVFSRSVEEVAMWWRELFWLLCERGIDGLGCTRTKLLEELSRAEAAYDQLLSQHSLYHRALLHSLGHASSLRLLRNDIDTIKAHALGVASAPGARFLFFFCLSLAGCCLFPLLVFLRLFLTLRWVLLACRSDAYANASADVT